MPTLRAMFRILSVTCLLMRKVLRLIIIPDTCAEGLHFSAFHCSYIVVNYSC